MTSGDLMHSARFSRSPRLSSKALLPLLAILVLAGCADPVSSEGACASDTDCGPQQFCDPAGACRCLTDDACDAGEFCNLAGSCQEKRECLSNEDCKDKPAAICDTRALIPVEDGITRDDNQRSRSGGQCVELNATNKQCLMDNHCPFGFFCSANVCVPGCQDNADCAAGVPCINNQCDLTPGACNEDGYCHFGEICDAGSNRCQVHRDADLLCRRCRGDSANPGCGTCLIDQAVVPTPCSRDDQCAHGYCVKFPCNSNADCNDGETCEGGGVLSPGRCSGHCGDFFCGNDSCDDVSAPCPRGYGCSSLIIVSREVCTRGGGQCQPGSRCSADAPGELNESGFCSCLSDADCPQQPLGPTLVCVDPGPNGACVQGTTCGPSDGLSCEDIR